MTRIKVNGEYVVIISCSLYIILDYIGAIIIVTHNHGSGQWSPKGDKPVIFQAPMFHFHAYGRKGICWVVPPPRIPVANEGL